MEPRKKERGHKRGWDRDIGRSKDEEKYASS